jgi:Cu-Zn family superoxide dismutase
VTLLLAAGAARAAQVQTAGTVPAAAGFPEGITLAPASKTYYVSSFTTGAVFRGTVGGAARQFLAPGVDGRTSATGVRVDQLGRLLVLTGTGGRLQVFNAHSGRLEANFGAGVKAGSNLNDLAVTSDGDVYITDFASPRIYSVTGQEITRRHGRVTDWLTPPTRTVPTLATGNLNGIAATYDGRYLLVGQTGNGALYRIDVASRAILRVHLSEAALAGSDGMLLQGHTLYVATHHNAVVVVLLNATYSRGRVVRTIHDPSFEFPTALAAAGNRLLVISALKPASALNYQIPSFPLGAS